MADGFLGRWAKRKEAVRQGKALEPEPTLLAPQQPSPQPSPASGRGSEGALPAAAGVAPSPLRREGGGEGAPEPQIAPPTLADTESLTPASDFARFVGPEVAPEVKNAALKKLFADPHFNVQDGLDVYIGDYSQPDPLPAAMLRQLASAKFLRMFDDEEEASKEGQAGKDPVLRDVADLAAEQSVAQSGMGGRIEDTEQAVPPVKDHADPDLRLQQDHAIGPRVPRQGAE
jgi:hypothetical protein